VKHPVIRSDDFSLEDFDPVCSSYLRKLAQQNAAESPSLKIVCDRKGDLSPIVCDSRIEGVTNNTLPVTAARNQSKRLVQVCFSMSFRGDGSTVLITVKPQPP